MKTLILIFATVILGSCQSATTESTSTDTVVVKQDSVVVDTTKVIDSLKK